MSDSLHVVCPHCDSINRVPVQRLGAGPKCGKCHGPLFAGKPLPLDQGRFTRHIERSDLPVLVDFWADWCGPCHMMAPAFEQAAQDLEPRVRLVKVNTEQAQQVATQYGIRSIPTLMLFKNGREAARVSGAMNHAQLLGWVRPQL